MGCYNSTDSIAIERPFDLQVSSQQLGHRIVENASSETFRIVLDAVKKAEAEKESPVYLVDIWRASLSI